MRRDHFSRPATSSILLEPDDLAPPAIKLEKLKSDGAQRLTFDKLRRTSTDGGHRSHVVGDTIVDKLHPLRPWSEQHQDADMSVLFERKVDYVGARDRSQASGCAGGRVTFSTVRGEITYRDFVTDDQRRPISEVNAVDRPLATDGQQERDCRQAAIGSEVDTLDNARYPTILEDITRSVRDVPPTAVVFSIRHGLSSPHHPAAWSSAAGCCFRVAEVKWRTVGHIMTSGLRSHHAERREARFALGDQDSRYRPLASTFMMQ